MPDRRSGRDDRDRRDNRSHNDDRDPRQHDSRRDDRGTRPDTSSRRDEGSSRQPTQQGANNGSVSTGNANPVADDEFAEDVVEDAMAAMMGFGGFGTTKVR